MLLLAFTAGLAVKVPLLFGYYMKQHDVFYVRNASLFVFPLLAVYFGWKRQVDRTTLQSVIENMAPVLPRLFTSLFAVLSITFLVTMLWTGRVVDIERNLLMAFDLLLAVVLGLLLYSISARDPREPAGVFDYLQVALVVSALLAHTVAL